MKLGLAFQFYGEDLHLHMVISEPCPKTQKRVIVNFTSWQHGYDQSCVVQAGEHEFLKHRSLVMYPLPKMLTDAYISKLLETGLIKLWPDLTAELLKKVQLGALNSKFMPIIPKQIIRDQYSYLLG